MTASEVAMGGNARAGTHQLVDRFPPTGGQFLAALQKARGFWPVKTGAEVALRAGYGLKNSDRLLTGERRMSAERALRLITSGAEGIAIFSDYVARLPARQQTLVWAALRREVRRVELKQRLAAHRQELDDLDHRLRPSARASGRVLIE